MFEQQLGLRENPFVAGHHPRFVYPSREHQEALAHLRYGIENREPFVLITGEVGTGKTTAIYDALAEWGTRAVVALITNSALTRAELIEEICLRFGVSLPSTWSKPQALVHLEAHLSALWRGGQVAILLLDEAQNLERELLEEIRLLSNLELDGQKLIQVFLVGQPELEARLSQPELRQLRQRIAIHYRLRPLSVDETTHYIHHRVAVAGGNAHQLFPVETCHEIARLTRGIPREINTLAGQALINAFVEDHRTVMPMHVVAAAQETEFHSVLEREAAAAPPAAPPPPATPPAAPPREPAFQAQGPQEEAQPETPIEEIPISSHWMEVATQSDPHERVLAEPAAGGVATNVPRSAEVIEFPSWMEDPRSRGAEIADPPSSAAPKAPAAGAASAERRARMPRIVPHPASPPRNDQRKPDFLTPRLRAKLREARDTAVTDDDSEPPRSKALALWITAAILVGLAMTALMVQRFNLLGLSKTPARTESAREPASAGRTSKETRPAPAEGPGPSTAATGAGNTVNPTGNPAAGTSAGSARPASSNPSGSEPVAPRPTGASATTRRSTTASTASAQRPDRTAAAPTTRFGLAVGTFLTEQRATEERSRLGSETNMASRLQTVTEDSVSMYRVVLGSFPDRSAAERAASALIQRGLINEARVVALARPRPSTP